MTRKLQAEAVITATDRTGAAFAAVGRRLKGLEGAMNRAGGVVRAGGQLERAGRAGAAAGQGATVLAGGLRLLGGVAAGGAVARAVKDFADLERRMERIAITADAPAGAGKAAAQQVGDLASQTGLTLTDLTTGLEALVAAGMKLPDALGFLPTVARTAQASGSEVKDIALSAQSLAESLKIPASEMQRAFDIMVAGGKAGKFELKDMSQALPSLAARAAAAGLKGSEGLQRLVAMLQIIRNQTGSSSEAATAMANVFAKMESEETVNKFKKFGIDLRKEMEDARNTGKDLLTVFFDLSEKALKGDLSKIPQLFADDQFQTGMRAILSQGEGLKKLIGDLKNVDGSTLKDFNRVMGTTAARLDQMGVAWQRMLQELGGAAAPFAIPAMQEITRLAQSISEGTNAISRFRAALREGRDAGNLPSPSQAPADPGVLGRYGPQVPAKALYDWAVGSSEQRDAAISDARRRGRLGGEVGRIEDRLNALRRDRERAERTFADTRGTGLSSSEKRDAMIGTMDAQIARLERALAETNARWAQIAGAQVQMGTGVVGRFGITGPVGAAATPAPGMKDGAPTGAILASFLAGDRITAKVVDPVKAELQGQADVKVSVTVEPSPNFLSKVKAAASSSGHVKATAVGGTGISMGELGTP